MLLLELSSHVLEIPNDDHTTLSQNPSGCSPGVLQADWWIFGNNEKATLNIKMPIRRVFVSRDLVYWKF